MILAAVRTAGKVDRVEIQSFDWRTLPLVHQAEPSIPLVALWNEETWAPDSPWLAGENAAVIGDPMIGALMVGANIRLPGLRPGRRQGFRRSGACVGAQGASVDDRRRRSHASTDRLIGVDGIITNYPTLLRGVLAELGMPLPPAYRRG